MTPEECDRIINERLARWLDLMSQSNATPLILIGIGHDAACGDLVLCIPEDVAPADACSLLIQAAWSLMPSGTQ